MAVGIIIHVTVGEEKRTEFFPFENIRLGSSEACNLQIHSDVPFGGVWLELGHSNGVYRVLNFQETLAPTINNQPLRRFVAIKDGDEIKIPNTGISFSFFSLTSKSSLITTKRDAHIAQFIEEAAIESAATPKRDDAKAFLREFVRELSREISWATKLIVLSIAVGAISGILYLGFAYNRELRKNRELAEQQSEIVRQLQDKISQTNDQLGELDKTNKQVLDIVSLARNLRIEYGDGICLIVGVYDLVDRKTGKTLRYPDPQDYQQNLYEPAPTEQDYQNAPPQSEFTTEGGGTPIEYDFVGTGFNVGGGYIVTNRHVLQPWEEDELVQQMMKEANGRARIKSLVIYFPNMPQPIPLKIRRNGSRIDLSVASFDETAVSAKLPILPLDANSDAVQIGKLVVTMGYPNGPDRLLAMVDDAEAKSINQKFGGSRQALISFLAQSGKIVPLTTQGAITDLQPRRIVHDAKTAEGGSGAPLFGQTGKVVGVNFGVFTGSTAANMAVPIRFAIDLLGQAGWKSPEEIQNSSDNPNQIAGANTDSSTAQK